MMCTFESDLENPVTCNVFCMIFNTSTTNGLWDPSSNPSEKNDGNNIFVVLKIMVKKLKIIMMEIKYQSDVE